jgi:hypothetical protein
MHANDDRRLKINEIIDHPRKRHADQRWADQRRRGTRVHLARRPVVPAWLEEEPKKKGSTLEEPGVEVGGDPEKASVAPKRQA